MSDRVRIQLQQGHDDICPSEKPSDISADAAIAALSKILAKSRKFKTDRKWEQELTSAVKKATDWIKRIKQAGGYSLERGSGNQKSFTFDYDRQEYRIDIECHGAKYADWFK